MIETPRRVDAGPPTLIIVASDPALRASARLAFEPVARTIIECSLEDLHECVSSRIPDLVVVIGALRRGDRRIWTALVDHPTTKVVVAASVPEAHRAVTRRLHSASTGRTGS